MRLSYRGAIAAAFAIALFLPFLSQRGALAVAGEPPVVSNPVEQGSPFVFDAAGLPSFDAFTASVTGPFLIAAHTTYTYGTIDGIHFGTTASTNGQCDPNAKYYCSSDILVEQLPSATVGLNYGVVTLSDGTSREIIANVWPASLIVSPSSLQLILLPNSSSDPLRVSLTNTSAAAISLGKPSFIDVAGGAERLFSFVNGCGEELAAGATCVVGAAVSPTEDLNAFGYVEIPTSLGAVNVLIEASGEASQADLKIDPQNLNFDIDAAGRSAVRTIQITNVASHGSESLTIRNAGVPCTLANSSYCLIIVSNDCAKIPARGTCEIKAQLEVSPTEYLAEPIHDFVYLNVSPSSGNGLIPINYTGYPTPGPPSPAVIALSPAALQFPSTVFGHPSDPQSLTVTNVSSRTVTVVVPSVANFIVDPSCTKLLPKESCEMLVRYVPTGGYPQTTGTLIASATDAADPTALSPAQAQQSIPVSGSSISEAALASPAFDGLVGPIDFNSTISLNVTNTSAISLIFGSIYGNLNYVQGEVVNVDTRGCGASLAPGKTCKLVVNAQECDQGADGVCFLTIESNALSSPDVYPLIGYAAADSNSQLNVDSGPVVFGHTPMGAVSASQVVHVALTNAVAQVNVPFEVLPVMDPDFKIDNECPNLLVPQPISGSGYATSCDIRVTFAPVSPGFHVGALTYRSSLMGSSVVLAGTEAVPVLSVTPMSLTFPAIGVGMTAASQTITVENTAASTTAITGITLAGGQADDFVIAKTCGSSLLAGASCTITVTFKPVSPGAKRASLIVADNAGDAPQSVTLSGMGTVASAAPSVKLSATSLTFANQAAGTTSVAQTITLTNVGSAVLELNSIAVSGGQEADDFILAKNCGASLAAGSSCTLSMTFQPVSAGIKAARITIVDNTSRSPHTVSLTGTGTVAVPRVNLSAISLTFVNQGVGTASPPQTVMITNSGSDYLILESISVVGAQAGDFILTNRCGNSLAPSSVCSLMVVFKPDSAGRKNASISIVDNASGSPQVVELSGTGD